MKRHLTHLLRLSGSLLLCLLFSTSMSFAQNPDPGGTWESIQDDDRFKIANKPSSKPVEGEEKMAGLNSIYTFQGRGNWSLDAVGSNNTPVGTIQAIVPPGSYVEQAYLYCSMFTQNTVPTVAFEGVTYSGTDWTSTGQTAGYLEAYRTDVTTQIRSLIGSGSASTFNFTVNSESPNGSIDGEALVIIYSNPSEDARQIIIYDGAASTTGDNTVINFPSAIPSVSSPNFEATLSLGIGFSCCGQTSEVDINGTRLTSTAGNKDDGLTTEYNGTLITMGGIGDSRSNPADPYNGDYDNDDELYDIGSFLSDGDNSITLNTRNPTNDDIIFFMGVNIASEVFNPCDEGDTAGPAVFCPDNQIVDCGSALLDYAATATATDNCDDMLTIMQTPAPGTIVNGNITVTLSAVDDSGNSGSCSFIVGPEAIGITCPSTQEVACGSSLADFTGQANPTGLCGGNIMVMQNPAPGTVINANTVVTLTATDDLGGSVSCSFDVNVPTPTITCPGNQQSCDEVLADYTSQATTSGFCGGNIMITQTPPAGTAFTGTVTVTLTAMDDAGGTATCSFEVGPPMDADMDGYTACDGDCDDNDPTVYPNAPEICDGKDNDCDGNVESATVYTVGLSDLIGMSTSCNSDRPYGGSNIGFTWTSANNQTPTSVTVDFLIGVDCHSTGQTRTTSLNSNAQTASFTSNSANCTCSNVTYPVSLSLDPADYVSGGQNTFLIDGFTSFGFQDLGNDVFARICVEYDDEVDPCDNDTTPPSFNCLSNQAINLDANCSASVPDYTGSVSPTDDCDQNPTVTQSPMAGTPITAPGNTTVTLTATDASGNSTSCSFQLMARDVTPPSLTCPATQSETADANCEATLSDYTSLATVSDACDSNPTVTQSPTAGTTINGNTTVTLIATDASGNSTSCSFTVTAQDVTPPTITCASDFTVPNDNGECRALVTFPIPQWDDNCNRMSLRFRYRTVDANDNPTGDWTEWLGGFNTDYFDVGRYEFEWRAQDAVPNSNYCYYFMEVLDSEAPSLTCLGTQSETADANCEATLSDYRGLATVSDNCDANPTVIQMPMPGTTINGNTVVTLMATDASGNGTSCTFTVELDDTTPPSISCPGTQYVNLDDNCSALMPNYTGQAGVSDNCDGNPVVTQSPTPGSPISGEGNTTVTLTATDASGNSTSCSFTVTALDVTPPTITCAADFTVPNDEGECRALVTFPIPQWDDNCFRSLLQFRYRTVDAYDNPTGDWTEWTGGFNTAYFDVDRYEFEWRAQDAVPNYNYCYYFMEVLDTEAPDAICLNPTVYLEPDGTYTLSDYEVFDFENSEDNCSAITVTAISPATVDCDDFDTTVPVMVTVTDEAGNTAQCTANVFVQKGDALPSGWAHDDVGGATGDAGFDPCEEKFFVESNGYTHPLSDKVHYAYQYLCGDMEITARVVSVDPHGFGGIMIRETMEGGSKKVALRTQLQPFVHRDVRATEGGYQQTQQLFRPQHSWLRLKRIGNLFMGYTSTNGVQWKFAFFANVDMNSCVKVGLFAEGPIDNTIARACFDNVSITGGIQPALVDNNGNGWETNTTRAVDFNIFPNPATNEVNVNLTPFEDETFTLRVFNNLGQEVYRKEYLYLEEYIEKLDLSQYNSGIYMLNIELEDGTILNKKFVVNRK